MFFVVYSLCTWVALFNELVLLIKRKKEVWIVTFVSVGDFHRHEAELLAAASQPLPDDDDDAFE